MLDRNIDIPQHKKPIIKEIPSTYVPARNTIFLSFALSFAEASRAEAIFIGAHTQDYSGYPDCRPVYFKAFKKVADSGTKAGIKGNSIKIFTPLLSSASRMKKLKIFTQLILQTF